MNAKQYREQRDALQVQINHLLEKQNSLRGVLDIIGHFLATGNDSIKLWNILTALRGPDKHTGENNRDCEIKMATTAVVRWHAFKKNFLGPGFPLIREDSDTYVTTRRAISDTPVGERDVDFHFWTHLTAAFQALGLTVRGYNDPEVSVAATVGHNEAQNFANQIGVR